MFCALKLGRTFDFMDIRAMENEPTSTSSTPYVPFFLVAGPCVVESAEICDQIANELVTICKSLNITLYFKASYKKANRSKLSSFTGLGDEKGLEIIRSIGEKYGVKTVTDIHESIDADIAAHYVDVLQIPAFLCRQTDLLLAAGRTSKIVNIKKGQFSSPESMKFAVEKVRSTGNDTIWLTDRGTMFGYQDLVVDYRGIPEMQKFDVPVVMDCTHSLQQPNQIAGVTGGRPDLIPTIAKAAIAVGAEGLFIETHPNPAVALSDGANMLPLHKMQELLQILVKIKSAII